EPAPERAFLADLSQDAIAAGVLDRDRTDVVRRAAAPGGVHAPVGGAAHQALSIDDQGGAIEDLQIGVSRRAERAGRRQLHPERAGKTAALQERATDHLRRLERRAGLTARAELRVLENVPVLVELAARGEQLGDRAYRGRRASLVERILARDAEAVRTQDVRIPLLGSLADDRALLPAFEQSFSRDDGAEEQLMHRVGQLVAREPVEVVVEVVLRLA